jgi:Ser/Thr protein kinase RdoA (MazF antagonist)
MKEYDISHIDHSKVGIEDRSGVFYWQTDRAVEPEIAGRVWADRHRYFKDDELVEAVNTSLGDDTLVAIEPLDLKAQTNLGNVNSVRVGMLVSGKEVIIRNHPKGIENGYFHAEATAAHIAKNAGLPSYDTLAVHDYDGGDDFAFQVLEKLPGTALSRWLEINPHDETALMMQAGKIMARLHQIQVNGFGPFDNEKAKYGELTGLHHTFGEAVRAGLAFNLDVLTKEHIFTSEQSVAISKLFSDDNPLLETKQAILVHNDFADWNLLTDGNDITGILDWDECVGGDAVSDIACWSTFFEPVRLKAFLDGYWQVADKPQDFDAKFELLRLRYVVSKMTLRIRRYSWDPSDFMKEKIESGRTHLAQSMEYFGLN